MLPGITRALVLEICQALGFETNKRFIRTDALRNSEAIFITQSVLGIVPITCLDGEQFGTSSIVEQIHRAYCELLERE